MQLLIIDVIEFNVVDFHSNELYRLKLGVASSLNYINLTDAANEKSPKLIPYPDWRTNFIRNPNQNATNSTSPGAAPAPAPTNQYDNSATIFSTFQIRVDECSRLWVMDTGLADVLGQRTQIAPPKLVIFDLTTDKFIRQRPLNENHIRENSFFANVVSCTHCVCIALSLCISEIISHPFRIINAVCRLSTFRIRVKMRMPIYRTRAATVSLFIHIIRINFGASNITFFILTR